MSENTLLAFRLRKVAKRTSEQNSDHSLFVDAADALEAAEPMDGWERVVAERIEVERDALAEQLAAAQAAIKEHDDGLISDCYFIGERLAQSPTDALEAHDWQVAARALTEAALAVPDARDYANTSRSDRKIFARWLRARAASIASEPEATP